MTYSYDLLDRLVEKSYHETGKPDLTIRYTYNAESQLARLRYEEDGETVGSYAFEYDSLGRLIRSTAMDENGSVTQRTEHLYDAFNRLSGQSWTLGAQTYSERYAYSDGEKGDGSLTSMTAATGDSLSFGYDALKRLNRVTVKNGSSVILNTAYAYRDVSWNRGSAQVEFRNVRLGSDSGMLLEGKKYSYDKAGNLVMISESTGDFNKLIEYTYDSQNQLTSEAYYKSGEAKAYLTYNYTYDTAGNLLTVSQKKGNTTTLLQTYTYGDAQWHDLLTAVNGQAITYDASGNPLSYGGWSFGWQNGRQLKMASKTSDGKTETLEYSYDADGIRTSKTYTVETFTQVPDYTVTFTADGATVKTMTVEDGYTLKDSDYPAVPTKTGYTGEWVKYTAAIHSNVTVQAKYTAVVTKYTVFFKADGFTVKAIQVNDGYVLQDADYPEVPAKVGCNGAWEKHTAAIHSNVTINAVYSPIASHYTVTFKANGKTLKTMTVADGYVLKTSDYPTIPKRAGYTGSWPKTGAIHANTTITAVYTKDSPLLAAEQRLRTECRVVRGHGHALQEQREDRRALLRRAPRRAGAGRGGGRHRHGLQAVHPVLRCEHRRPYDLRHDRPPVPDDDRQRQAPHEGPRAHRHRRRGDQCAHSRGVQEALGRAERLHLLIYNSFPSNMILRRARLTRGARGAATSITGG